MQRVDIDLHKLSLSLINIYAPNIGTERIWFLDLLNRAMSDIPQERMIILAGGFSCTQSETHSEPHPLSAEALRTGVQNHTKLLRCVEGNLYLQTGRQYTCFKSTPEKILTASPDRFYILKSPTAEDSLTVIFIALHSLPTIMSRTSPSLPH